MAEPSAPIDALSQRLAIFTAAKRAEAGPLGDLATSFVERTAATVSGGKRLRARFALEGWRSVSDDADPPAAVHDIAGALEVFHAAALVHDDIVDNSDTRRGRPSMHRALESWHSADGWAGDGAQFGRSAALLAGDLLVAWSDDLLEDGLAGILTADATRRAYAVMRREVTVGQFLDVAEEHAYRAIPNAEHAARALLVASVKSARYSMQHPLVIGAMAGGATTAQEDALARFGHAVGMAFQLRDDILGVIGDADVTGKPAGDDLREGKRTVLIAYLRETLDAAGRDRVDALLGAPGLTDRDVAALQHELRASGAIARVETLVEDYVAQSDAALDDAPLAPASITRLRALADASARRTA